MNKHLIRYPNGIEWEQLRTTFSMPDLYRYATLEDESSGQRVRKREHIGMAVCPAIHL